MKSRHFLYAALLILSFSATRAQDALRGELPKPTDAVKHHEYQGDQINLVLRWLAQEAKINILVSDSVKGTITMRLTDLSAMDAIRVICASKQLILNQFDEVYYVMTPAERLESLHYLDRDALPAAMAKFKKRYYEALLQEGFSKDEALKIVASESLPLNDLKIEK